LVDTVRTGLWNPWYEGVSTIVSAQGDMMWQMTEADLLTATIRTLVSKNSVTDEKLPYLAPLRVDGSFAHWFSSGLLVAGDVQLIGTRAPDLRASRTLDPFVLLDISAEYSFLPGWRVLSRIANLLGTRHEWWEGYVSLPRTGSLGITYSW
jgi:outer membrane cobalamin receptor